MLSLLKNLMSQGGMSVIFAFLVTRSRHLRRILAKERASVADTALMILFFASIGILGTYTGIPVHGAIANARIVGVFVGGLLGGPVVGIAAGIIAGFHRWAIDIGGFTALACAVSTAIEGAMAAALHRRFSRARDKWLFATVSVAIAEAVQMAIILLIARPFADAVALVRIIAVPMIVGNAFGVGMFIAVSESLYREKARVAATQAQETLRIANQTVEIFRKGLTRENAEAAAHIMMEHLDVTAVSFSSTDIVLAHVGEGQDHHRPGEPLRTRLTRQVIRTKRHAIAQNPERIGCNDPDCPLGCAVIAPLFDGESVVGTLKLYRRRGETLTTLDTELGLGLAGLFSIQLELSRIEVQRQLVTRAELDALQSQINPHFLFNALNTIGSLIRTNPDRARQLLVRLSSFFRRNLATHDEVSLEQEIDHIRGYLEIEKARFGNRLTAVFDIDPEAHVKIPPLILQPIVENAVKHGLLPQVEGGTVTVTARTNGKSVQISVADDGAGIPRDKLKSLLEMGTRTDSVGLQNVDRRLRALFGTGLEVVSSVGRGTTVTMSVPRAEDLLDCVS